MVVVVTLAAASMPAVAFMVAELWEVELAIAEAASVLAECAPHVVFRTSRARDHASLRLEIHRIGNFSPALLLPYNLRV